jgi:hypothetical protein
LDDVSHVTITDYLSSERLTARGLWELVIGLIQNDPEAFLLVDDSVQDKRYSRFIELVKLQYSGAEHSLRPGLDLEAAARAVNAWVIALGDSQMFPYLNTYFQVTDETVVFERALESVLSILGITSTFGRKRQAEKTRWRHGWRNTHRNRYAKMHVVKPIWQAQMILPI